MLPETRLQIKGTKLVNECAACGSIFQIRRHKVNQYILKNPDFAECSPEVAMINDIVDNIEEYGIFQINDPDE